MTAITVRSTAPAEVSAAWVLAGRDTERQAWDALYSALYPRPGCDGAHGSGGAQLAGQPVYQCDRCGAMYTGGVHTCIRGRS
jgi:hypothetical protein